MPKETKPLVDEPQKAPLPEAEKAQLRAILAAEPADGVKYTEDERELRKTAKQTLLADEDTRARFKRLSTARLNAALDTIALIGNLSGPNYDYSAAQIDFIRGKLHADVDKAMDRFKPKVPKDEKELVEIPD